jgi:hypothetical protein
MEVERRKSPGARCARAPLIAKKSPRHAAILKTPAAKPRSAKNIPLGSLRKKTKESTNSNHAPVDAITLILLRRKLEAGCRDHSYFEDGAGGNSSSSTTLPFVRQSCAGSTGREATGTISDDNCRSDNALMF